MKTKLLLLCLMAILTLTATAHDRNIRLRIIGTSDIHGNYLPYDYIDRRPWQGGLSRVQTYVKAQREKLGRDRVVLLDNGDILQGQPTAYYYNFIDTASTHLCAAALNYIGYDAGTVGNHDIETGHAVYDRWVSECAFPMLGANVIVNKTGKPYWKPYTIIERDGVRIAVLGMITPGIPQWLPETLWSGLHFADLVETARYWMPELRYKEKADIVIGLFHSGVGRLNARGRLNENAALQVARSVPGFDLVICGHDHREACQRIQNVRGDSVLVLNPAANGMKVAEADVTLSVKRGKIVDKKVEGRLADIADLTPDADYISHFSRQAQAVEQFVSEVIGHNETTLSTRPAYFGPSAFIDFIHTLQLKISGADISFCAPLAFDAEIPAGDIRVSDMFNLYKYENLLYVMRLTGREIHRYLEYSYAGWTTQMHSADDHLLLFREGAEKLKDSWQRLKTPSYNFDSAAGLRYIVDVSQPAGSRVHIQSMADGRVFDEDSTYRVAVNSYRGGGGGDLLTKGAGIAKDSLKSRIVWSTEKDLRYYLMQEIRRLGDIAPKALDQWRFVPESWVEGAARRDAELLFR